jgi:Fe-S-cluster-containing hydrogenase component 2
VSPEAILDTFGNVCRSLKKPEWPKAVVIDEKCIGSGCELCINICPFDALSLQHTTAWTTSSASPRSMRRSAPAAACARTSAADAVHIFPLKHEILKDWDQLSEQERELVKQAREPMTA